MKHKNHNQYTDGSWEGWSDAEVWENINNELDNRKKRRLLPWFFLVGFGVISSCLIVYLTYFNNPEIPSNPEIKPATIIANSQIATQKYSENNSQVKEDALVAANEQAPILNNSKNDFSIFNNTNNKISNSRKHTLNDSKLVVKDHSTEVFDISAGLTLTENPSILHENTTIVDEKDLRTFTKNIDYLSNREIKPISPTVSQKIKKNILVDNPSSVEKRPSFYLFFENGIGYSYLKNEYKPDIEWQHLSNNNIANTLSTFHSISVTKTLKNNILLNMGLHYARSRSNLIGSHKIQTIETFESDSARVQIIENIKYYYSGLLTKTVIKNEHFNVHNTRSILSMPIQIGYMLYGQKRSLMIMAGIQYTLAQSLSGYTYDTDETIVPYHKLQHLKIEKQGGFSDVMGEIKYLQNIHKSLDFSLGLGLKYPIKQTLSTFDEDNNYQNSNNNAYYLQVGIGYKW